MADAQDVLEVTIDEMAVLASIGGHLPELQALANLARSALHAVKEGREIPDKEVRASGLLPPRLRRLGL